MSGTCQSGLLYRGPAVGRQLVLRWGQEQLEGAAQALESTAKLLRDLRKASQKHRQVFTSISSQSKESVERAIWKGWLL